jgi:hypothetical protein
LRPWVRGRRYRQARPNAPGAHSQGQPATWGSRSEHTPESRTCLFAATSQLSNEPARGEEVGDWARGAGSHPPTTARNRPSVVRRATSFCGLRLLCLVYAAPDGAVVADHRSPGRSFSGLFGDLKRIRVVAGGRWPAGCPIHVLDRLDSCTTATVGGLSVFGGGAWGRIRAPKTAEMNTPNDHRAALSGRLMPHGPGLRPTASLSARKGSRHDHRGALNPATSIDQLLSDARDPFPCPPR